MTPLPLESAWQIFVSNSKIPHEIEYFSRVHINLRKAFQKPGIGDFGTRNVSSIALHRGNVTSKHKKKSQHIILSK